MTALGFCTAWAVLDGGVGLAAGALASGSLSPLLKELAQSTMQGASGWWINTKVARGESARARELPETRLLLENDHLLQLLDLALAETLRSAKGQRGFEMHTDKLERSARASAGLFLALAATHRGELLEELRVPNLFVGAGERPGPLASDLDTLVDELQRRSGLDLTVLRPRLLVLLDEKFSACVEGLLKRDVLGRTPLEGQAYAALWLQVQRKFATDLAEILARLHEIPGQLAQLERR
ncbi:MAG TPA: hypothetical protein VMT18_07055, partial [Planctomycetota bacterium]|nr:hypothetical protein [Planctomycetota bacterium]